MSKKPRLEAPSTPDMSKMTIKDDDNVFKTPQQCETVLFKTPHTVEMAMTAKRQIQRRSGVNPRLQQIKQTEANVPSNYSTPENSSYSSNWETPLWLKSPSDPKRKNFEFKINLNPDFDRNVLLKYSPNPMDPSNPLTPLNEVVVRTFKQFALNAQIPGYYDCSSDSPVYEYDHEVKRKEAAENQRKIDLISENIENNEDSDENDVPSATPYEVKEMKEILKNTNVYISKKLAKSQSELNTIVELLGGDFMWIYNKTCTHLVYTGKLTDNNKELRSAKEKNIAIVSPYWLYACQEQKQRVDESFYPRTYNPSKCAVVTSRTPKVSLNAQGGGGSGGGATPVSSRHHQDHHLTKSSQQPPRSQTRKTTTQNIIKNYCRDEEDENEDENLLLANSQL